MSDRERWTVYPLLFLALGVSLRGNFSPTHHIRCHNLSIHRPDGMVQMELTSAPPEAAGGGSFRMISEDGKVGVAMRAVPHGGLIEVAGPNGQPQVILEPTPAGGALVANSADLRAQMALLLNGAKLTVVAPDGQVKRFDFPFPYGIQPAVKPPHEGATSEATKNEEGQPSGPQQAPADNPPAAEEDKPAADEPEPARGEQPTSSTPAGKPPESPAQPKSPAR